MNLKIVPQPSTQIKKLGLKMTDFTHQEAQQIAEEAYIYGLQQAVFYETRFTFTQFEVAPVFAGVNCLTSSYKPAGPAWWPGSCKSTFPSPTLRRLWRKSPLARRNTMLAQMATRSESGQRVIKVTLDIPPK